MSFSGLPTDDQKTDQHFATNAEIKEILVFHDELEKCRVAEFNRLTAQRPTIAPIFWAAVNKNADALTGLTAKKLTWGDYVSRLEAIRSDYRAAVATEAQRMGQN